MHHDEFDITKFLERLEANLRTHCQCKRDETLLIGVSGGADSMAVLFGCQRLGHPVYAVHINHHLRKESDKEASHVQLLCEEAGIPTDVVDVHPAESPGNIEANARQQRYNAFADIAKQHSISTIAVGHHADDQFETCLMQLFRGCGPQTLGGMAWHRTLDETSVHTCQLIRPLLNVSRDHCQAFCNALGIQWLEDPSNHDRSRTRSRLRHDVVPILEEMFPNVRQRLPESLARMRELADVAMLQVDATFGSSEINQWQRNLLRDSPSVIVKAGLHRAAMARLQHSGKADRLNARHLEEAVAAICDDNLAPRQYDWPGGLLLHITSKVVRLESINS